MKIITITYNDPGISWGPAIHFLELWNSAVTLHPEIDIEGIAPSWTGNAPILTPRFDLRQVRVPNIAKGRQIVYDLKVASRLLKARASDIVYVRLSQFHFFSTWIMRLRRNRVFLELNGLLVDDAVSAKRSSLFRRFVRWQEGALVRRANGVISVSEGITDAIRATFRPQGRMITLRNGVGTHFFEEATGASTGSSTPSHTRKTTILYVGTFTPWDGSTRIVELARRFPDVQFHLVGDGPAQKTVQATATPNMSFFGQVPYAELPRFYRSADAGIVLYEVERHQRVHLSSLKTLEYLASGLPVFTTNVPGQEFVADLGCGVLSGESTLVDDFNAFLQRLPDYRTLAQIARQLARREHSWDSVADKTIAFIREVVAPESRRARSNEP